VLLDVVAAVAAGGAEGWDVRPDHFSERHGLFVIIALGESLIVAGAGLTGAERTTQTVAVAILAVAVTCGLWWSYFVTAKPLLDDGIRRRDQADRTHLARDVYSILPCRGWPRTPSSSSGAPKTPPRPASTPPTKASTRQRSRR
jgi:low temperature requirement protein LtrA